MTTPLHLFFDLFADSLFALSLFGLWPRYIEPYWLEVRYEKKTLGDSGKRALRLAHLSDLHWGLRSSSKLLLHVLRALEKGKPDLILFTGDFLCYAQSFDLAGLETLLKNWCQVAPVRVCLGNHDYEKYVTQRDGEVKIQERPLPFLLRALKRFFFKRSFFEIETHKSMKIAPQADLVALLEKLNIPLLRNQTRIETIEDQSLTLLGLGDLWAEGGDSWSLLREERPQVILAHNPDSLDRLESFEKALVLSGHTHGGTLHLPLFEERMRSVKSRERLRGWIPKTKHYAYVNRGLSSPYPLRLFSRPELTWIDLTL